MSDLVGNPEDRFSRVAALFTVKFSSFTVFFGLCISLDFAFKHSLQVALHKFSLLSNSYKYQMIKT